MIKAHPLSAQQSAITNHLNSSNRFSSSPQVLLPCKSVSGFKGTDVFIVPSPSFCSQEEVGQGEMNFLQIMSLAHRILSTVQWSQSKEGNCKLLVLLQVIQSTSDWKLSR